MLKHNIYLYLKKKALSLENYTGYYYFLDYDKKKCNVTVTLYSINIVTYFFIVLRWVFVIVKKNCWKIRKSTSP
jgi:hypothetical protein